jgi:3,4-dihydroxy 2-butanone 4-phosphate synthase / GTP cyclohydrolase II
MLADPKKIFSSIETGLHDLRVGRSVILADDEHREQEGDLVIAAEKITPEGINFLTKYARGVVCLTMTEDIMDRLRIPLMPDYNKLPNQAAFGVSIEAATGVSTGVSAKDRAHTIQVAVNPQSTHRDISMPGHVFPLRARRGGVLERPGHTEGSVDLTRLAGLQPAAVICEIMNEDGSMARLPDLKAFADQHHINIIAINDLIDYRLKNETTIQEISASPLPLKYSPDFKIKIFQDCYSQAEHIALIHGNLNLSEPILVRIHSECMTGDVLGSSRCDCGWQLDYSLNAIAKQNGIVLYMRQEGRGIGLSNKIKAYELQMQGLDTVEANHQLGFLSDHRHYGFCAQMLRCLGVNRVRLLTNNINKINALTKLGIQVIDRVPIVMTPTPENQHYLKTKKNKLGHLLD